MFKILSEMEHTPVDIIMKNLLMNKNNCMIIEMASVMKDISSDLLFSYFS